MYFWAVRLLSSSSASVRSSLSSWRFSRSSSPAFSLERKVLS